LSSEGQAAAVGISSFATGGATVALMPAEIMAR